MITIASGLDFFGLRNGDFGGECGFLYRGERDFVAAAARTVGLGDDTSNCKVALSKQVFESGDGELRGTAEQ
jgi:hypothetical protein